MTVFHPLPATRWIVSLRAAGAVLRGATLSTLAVGLLSPLLVGAQAIVPEEYAAVGVTFVVTALIVLVLSILLDVTRFILECEALRPFAAEAGSILRLLSYDSGRIESPGLGLGILSIFTGALSLLGTLMAMLFARSPETEPHVATTAAVAVGLALFTAVGILVSRFANRPIRWNGLGEQPDHRIHAAIAAPRKVLEAKEHLHPWQALAAEAAIDSHLAGGPAPADSSIDFVLLSTPAQERLGRWLAVPSTLALITGFSLVSNGSWWGLALSVPGLIAEGAAAKLAWRGAIAGATRRAAINRKWPQRNPTKAPSG